MARLKKGLDFFYFDISFYDNIKIRKLIRYHGAQSVVVYQLVLIRIYTEGYYLHWDDDLPFIVAEVSHLQDDYVKTVIDYCIEIGLFDKQFFESDQILTSKGIQNRFFDFCVVSKRKVAADSPYLLVDLSTKALRVSKVRNNSEPDLFENNIVLNNSEQSGNSPELLTDGEDIILNKTEKEGDSSEIGTQSKVKESKVKHSSSADIRAREGKETEELVDEEQPEIEDGVADEVAEEDDVKRATNLAAEVDAEVYALLTEAEWKKQVFERFKFLKSDEKALKDNLLRWAGEVRMRNRGHTDLTDAKDHFKNWLIRQEYKFNQNLHRNGNDNNNGNRTVEDLRSGSASIIARMEAAGRRSPK